MMNKQVTNIGSSAFRTKLQHERDRESKLSQTTEYDTMNKRVTNMGNLAFRTKLQNEYDRES